MNLIGLCWILDVGAILLSAWSSYVSIMNHYMRVHRRIMLINLLTLTSLGTISLEILFVSITASNEIVYFADVLAWVTRVHTVLLGVMRILSRLWRTKLASIETWWYSHGALDTVTSASILHLSISFILLVLATSRLR